MTKEYSIIYKASHDGGVLLSDVVLINMIDTLSKIGIHDKTFNFGYRMHVTIVVSSTDSVHGMLLVFENIVAASCTAKLQQGKKEESIIE